MAMARPYHKDSCNYLSNFFRREEIYLSPEDFDKPTRDGMVQVYTWFFEKLTGRPSNVLRTTFHSIKSFPFPELHQDSAPMMVLCLSINNILVDTGFNEDFMLPDLMFPDSKKMHRVIWHLHDAYKSRLGRHSTVVAILDKARASKDEIRRLEAEYEQLKERVNNARVRLTERELIIEKLSARKKKGNALLQEKAAAAHAAKERMSAADEKFKNMESKLVVLKQQIEHKKEILKQLDSLIVKSPDRLVNEVKTLEAEKRTLSEEIAKLNTRVADQEEEVAKLSQVEPLVDSLSLEFQQVLQDKKRLDETQKEATAAAEELASIGSKVDTMQVKVDSKRKDLESQETRFEALKEEADKRRQACDEEKGQLENQLAEMAHGKYGDSKVKALDENIASLQKQIRDEEIQHENFAESVKVSFEGISKAVAEAELTTKQFMETVKKEVEKNLK